MLRSFPSRARRGGLVASVALATCLGTAVPALAQDANDTFFRAYYLENEKGDLTGALELYREAAKDARRSPDLLKRIEQRIQACTEELATSDLAALAPGDSILYVELNDPGEQLSNLLNQLGLLQGTEGAGGIAVSPHLIEGVLGLRGAAVAITHIDPSSEMPSGVLILNPGDMQAVRGLIETALPAGGRPTEDIGGHPTYLIEGMVHVTMGERLIVAGTDRALIGDVLRRVGGDQSDSFALNPAVKETMTTRGSDLLYFCLNAEPVMPMLQGMLREVAQYDREAAMAIGLLDVESLRTVSGRFGVGDNGVSMDVGMQLADGHDNIAFNLMRMPHVTKSTFELVPSGVAAFIASSVNQAGAGDAGLTDEHGKPVVSVMDLGREVFGNLVDIAFFSLPSVSEGPGGMPLPDAAIAMSVNDVERSKAIWNLALGIAQGMTGGGEREPQSTRVGGDTVDRYGIEGVNIYLYAHKGRIVLSPSLRAMEAAVKSADGHNVTADPMFADLVASTSKDHTSVMGVSLGRAAEIAKQVLPRRDLAEVGPYLELLKDSTLVATTRHSDTELRVSASLNGLPHVGPLVEKFVRAEMGGGGSPAMARERFTEAPARVMSASAAVAPAKTVAVELAAPAAVVDLGALTRQFNDLADAGHSEVASRLIPAVSEAYGEDWNGLNTFVWEVISSEVGADYAEVLAPVIEHANELANESNWYVLDTYAHVEFARGHVARAVKLATSAVEIANSVNDDRADEAEASLARFRKASGVH